VHEQVVHGFDVFGEEAHVGFLEVFWNKTALSARDGTQNCSIADVSLTGHGKCCSSQNRSVCGGTFDVSAYMEHIESRFGRDVNAV
jgi:hypothetical protein